MSDTCVKLVGVQLTTAAPAALLPTAPHTVLLDQMLPGTSTEEAQHWLSLVSIANTLLVKLPAA